MPRPGARQPLFQPPVAGGGRRGGPEEEGEAPRAGERGWLVSLAERMREEQGGDTGVSSGEGSQSQGAASSGASRASGEGPAGLAGGPSADSGLARSSQAASQGSVASSMELLASQAVSSQVLAMTVGPATQVTTSPNHTSAPCCLP